MSRLLPSEYQEQKALMQWANYTKYNDKVIGDYLFHVPNGGSRMKLEAKRLKDLGVKAGVSDMFLPIPTERYHGLWIELKKRDKLARITVLQMDWINRMQEMGYEAIVVYGWEEAKERIEVYLGINKISSILP